MNFIDQAALGVHILGARHNVSLELRYMHISNAGLGNAESRDLTPCRSGWEWENSSAYRSLSQSSLNLNSNIPRPLRNVAKFLILYAHLDSLMSQLYSLWPNGCK